MVHQKFPNADDSKLNSILQQHLVHAKDTRGERKEDIKTDLLSKTSHNAADFLRGVSPTESLTRNSSRLSERTKKKAWYDVLYPTYNSRYQDFERLFKEAPLDERLIVDYSCALYRDLFTLISTKPDEGCISKTQMTRNTAATSKESSTDRLSNTNVVREIKVTSAPHDVKRKVAEDNRGREEINSKKVENVPTIISDSSEVEGKSIPTVATPECTSPHEGRQLVHIVLPINIETLFNLLFSKSKFLLDFHTMRKSTELVFGEWATSEEGQSARTVNVTVPLAAAIGPKTSKVTEYQVIRDCSKKGELYSVDVNSVNAGIPYADSFSLLTHYCLVKKDNDHTLLSVHAQIIYKKSIWGVVKGFIEKNTWSSLEDFYGSLLKSLQCETCPPPAKAVESHPPKGSDSHVDQSVQMRSLEEVPPQTEPIKHLIGAQAFASRAAAECPVVFPEPPNKYRWLPLFLLVLLSFLIIVNVILMLKLWRLEDRLEEDLSNRERMPNFSALKDLPTNQEDWIELLRQQETLHETELRKWHTVFQTAIELLKKTDNPLTEPMFRKPFPPIVF